MEVPDGRQRGESTHRGSHTQMVQNCSFRIVFAEVPERCPRRKSGYKPGYRGPHAKFVENDRFGEVFIEVPERCPK